MTTPRDFIYQEMLEEKNPRLWGESHIYNIAPGTTPEAQWICAENLLQTQQNQAHYYDRGARLWIAEPGDRVLLLLHSESKLCSPNSIRGGQTSGAHRLRDLSIREVEGGLD